MNTKTELAPRFTVAFRHCILGLARSIVLLIANVMTDANWLRRLHEKRCASKIPFAKATRADTAAQKASRKTGELIISYQCFDCGQWHIGHADKSQILARRPLGSPCQLCGRPIPQARMTRSRKCSAPTETCSARCHAILTNARRKKKRAERQQAEACASTSQNETNHEKVLDHPK